MTVAGSGGSTGSAGAAGKGPASGVVAFRQRRFKQTAGICITPVAPALTGWFTLEAY